MNDSAIKQLIILALCAIAAVLCGVILASGSYEYLFVFSYLVMGVYVLAAPGFIPLIAFGLLSPFTLPIPFIWNVPFMGVILAICCVKLFFHKAVTRKREPYQHCF